MLPPPVMTSSHYRLTVDADDISLRLDKFLARHLPEFSRSRLQALIEEACVSCGGKAIVDAAHKVKLRETYEIQIPEVKASYLEPQAIDLDIIFEDDDMLVLNKQAGLTVHPGAGNPDMTLVNALLAHCGESLSGIGGVARPGIVHRIDKDTTGLLVVAKNDAAHLALSAQLADRSLKRTYQAIVWGTPKPKSGTITANIGRSFSNRQKMAVVPKGGKPAVTHYTLLKDLGVASLVECNLETGRTHQIRVHMMHIGHPLLGDQTYGQSTENRLKANSFKSLTNKAKEALLNFKRQALHSRELALIHPVTGKAMRFESELPEDMRMLIESLK